MKVLSHPAYSLVSIWTPLFLLHTVFNIKHSITIMMWVHESISTNSDSIYYSLSTSHTEHTTRYLKPIYSHIQAASVTNDIYSP